MHKYDLLSEPWIPVVRLDGTPAELSLRAVLDQAPDLREIRDPMPTVEFGLYRLFTALVMDIFRLESTADLGDLLAAGAFDAAALNGYFGQWGERFDLFHPRYPFLQCGTMAGETAKPLAGLLPAIPSGTNAWHFHHAREETFGVSPAAAARLLTLLAPFMTAGGAGLAPSINGAPPWYGLVTGRTLFETLCLNCCVLPLPLAVGTAPPAWRDDRPPKNGRSTEASLLEALTWRPRRIRLLPGPAGHCALTGRETPVLIRTMYFTAGASCDFTWQDPAVPYRYSAKNTLPFRPQDGKELWRDTGPLALLRQGDYESSEGKVRFERPLLVSQYAELLEGGHPLPPFALTIYGMRTDMKMKVFEWQRERLTLRPGLLRRGIHAGHAQRAMELADSVAYTLAQAIRKTYPREGKSNKQAYQTLITAAQRDYWTALREAYERLLDTLCTLPEEEEAREAALKACHEDWGTVVKATGYDALERAIRDLDTDADALQRQVEARTYFRIKVWALLNPQEAQARRARRRQATTPTAILGGGSHD